ncbi:type IV secretory system conjugative DNA transfer family protein [Grimontia hollisae]|uniref:type IV secretory system conjugative DNA transfer family protein n=1 Tax=Grimontia hollisae TaxID=673 RepID=UPI0023DCC41E|nr:type IV secretory system conjugative DNA transfer family protein [Grimontia hollisae]MDF2185260.1 type IV secretory system conjugative DNA transfer family protein [Grimontia hollisae]
MGIAFVMPLSVMMLANRNVEQLHGSARWANHNEVFNLYKLAKRRDDGKGIIIGRLGRRFLYYTGNAFVFLAAPSRTGKGKSLKEHLTGILAQHQDLPTACVEAFQGFLALDEEKGQSNVASTLKAALQDWNNPIFDAATSANDFNFHDLRKIRRRYGHTNLKGTGTRT